MTLYYVVSRISDEYRISSTSTTGFVDVLVELQGYYELSRIDAKLPWIAAKFPSR